MPLLFDTSALNQYLPFIKCNDFQQKYISMIAIFMRIVISERVLYLNKTYQP